VSLPFESPPMTNLTLSLDDTVVRQARVRAIEQGTSLSAKIREFLQQYAKGDEPATRSHAQQTQQLIDLMAKVRKEAKAQASPRKTSLRDDIYNDQHRKNTK
jgi:plasmid stability protein